MTGEDIIKALAEYLSMNRIDLEEAIENLVRKHSDDMVTIKRSEYDRLIKASDFLERLQACGVDNWSGYDDAVDMED